MKRTIDSFFVKPPSAKKPTVDVAAPVADRAPASTSTAAPDTAATVPSTAPPAHESRLKAESCAQGRTSDAAPTSSSALSDEQKQRMQLNKGSAFAKLALKKAGDLVANARVNGHSPALQQLLFEVTGSQEPGWNAAMAPEFKKDYFIKLEKFVHSEWKGKTPIYPPQDMVFRAFNTCAFENTRVVILGQDPYHGPNQAMGLCFSVPRGEKVPSSLLNMYKELQTDLGYPVVRNGDLHKWATQGVLLLNTCLTVRQAQANSHSGKGWETFTDAAIRAVSQKREGLVFMLWGAAAKKKATLIDSKKHTILQTVHPSGLSASRGFFGSKPFSQANEAIVKNGGNPIQWQIDP